MILKFVLVVGLIVFVLSSPTFCADLTVKTIVPMFCPSFSALADVFTDLLLN